MTKRNSKSAKSRLTVQSSNISNSAKSKKKLIQSRPPFSQLDSNLSVSNSKTLSGSNKAVIKHKRDNIQDTGVGLRRECVDRSTLLFDYKKSTDFSVPSSKAFNLTSGKYYKTCKTFHSIQNEHKQKLSNKSQSTPDDGGELQITNDVEFG